MFGRLDVFNAFATEGIFNCQGGGRDIRPSKVEEDLCVCVYASTHTHTYIQREREIAKPKLNKLL